MLWMLGILNAGVKKATYQKGLKYNVSVHYLSQVHQVSNLIFITVPVLTVVLQDEVLSETKHSSTSQYISTLSHHSWLRTDGESNCAVPSRLVRAVILSEPARGRRHEVIKTLLWVQSIRRAALTSSEIINSEHLSQWLPTNQNRMQRSVKTSSWHLQVLPRLGTELHDNSTSLNDYWATVVNKANLFMIIWWI